MATNFWSDKAQFLLNAIRFKDGVSVGQLSADPTAVAMDANTSSIGFFGGTIYQKQDNGSTTNWSVLTTMSSVAHLFSTGIIDGAEMSDAGSGEIDITAAKSIYVDINDMSNIKVSEIDIPAENGLALTNIGSSTATYIGYNFLTSSYIQQTSRFSQEQKRDIAAIGIITHPAGVIDDVTPSSKIGLISPMSALDDTTNAIGAINIEGNMIGDVGANLSIGKTAGRIFKFEANMDGNPKDPSEVDQVEIDTSVSGLFSEFYSNGLGGTSGTAPGGVIDPTIWDDGTGVLNTVNANNWSVKKVYIAPVSNQLYVETGTEEFNSINQARQRYLSSPTRIDAETTRDLLLRGYIAVRGGATDLSLSSDAVFIAASKFGEGVSGGAASVDNNRQETYDNSVDGVTLLEVGKPKIDRDSSTPITGNIREITDNSGAVKYWSVASTHNQVSDSDGSFAIRKSIKYPFIEDFKVNAPSSVISVSGGGTVASSDTIPAIPVVSGHQSALLNSTLSGATFSFESIDTTQMSTLGKKVSIEFDSSYLSALPDTYFAYVEYSTDNVTFVSIPNSESIRITGAGSYSIPFEHDKTTHPYVRLVIESENILLNSRISVDNYRLNVYLDSKLDNGVFVGDAYVTDPIVNSTYILESGNGDLIVTMPQYHTSGDKLTIKHLMDGITEWVEIVPYDTESIDGQNTGYFMYDENQSVTLISDGTDWYII